MDWELGEQPIVVKGYICFLCVKLPQRHTGYIAADIGHAVLYALVDSTADIETDFTILIRDTGAVLDSTIDPNNYLGTLMIDKGKHVRHVFYK